MKLWASRNNGEIKPLASHLVDGGISHLQYADDTIIMIENDNNSIMTVKFILYCFEAMSGLRINYQKSEVFGLGVESEELERAAGPVPLLAGDLLESVVMHVKCIHELCTISLIFQSYLHHIRVISLLYNDFWEYLFISYFYRINPAQVIPVEVIAFSSYLQDKVYGVRLSLQVQSM